MNNRVLRSISRFFSGTGEVVGTPSGDARGLIRVYTDDNDTVTRGRSF